MYEKPVIVAVGSAADVVLAEGEPDVFDEMTKPALGQPTGFVAGLDD